MRKLYMRYLSASYKSLFVTSIFLLLFLGITYINWVTQPRIENEDNQEQETLKPPQLCTDANWSAGSAFFTLTALMFGYIAHPRGSLIWNRSGRMWRLTPAFAFLEFCVIWTRIALSLWAKVPFRVICHTLMAVRVGNSWHPFEIKEFLQKTRDATDEGAGIIPAAETYIRADASSFDGNTNLDRTPPSDRRQNVDVYQLSRHSSQTPTEGHSVAPTTIPSLYRSVPSVTARDRLPYHETCDRIFQEHLNLVSDFERGPSFRIFIWVPMVLQAIKLVSVAGPGAILTQIAGWVYLISWLSIEILMVTIAERPLTVLERSHATSLSKQWRKHFETPDMLSERRWGVDSETIPPATFTMSLIFGFLVGACDCYWTIFLCSLSPGSKAESASRTPLNFLATAVSNLEYIVLLVATTFFCLSVMHPGLIQLAQLLLDLVWRRLTSYLWFDLGPLWFKKPSPDDLELLWPAYLALYNYFIIFLYHTGIWWIKPFECWETTKPAYYDWLG
jgi:hypothetical protein